MRVLLEFGLNFCIFAYCFLSFLRVLLECGSYSRAGLFRGFTVHRQESINDNAKMDEVLLRFPLIGLEIFQQLDDKNLTRCREISKTWCKFIDNHGIILRRKIKKYLCKKSN